MIVLSGDPSKATIAIPSPCAPLALSLESVIALCPGRHKIKRLTAKSKPLRDEDGNIVKEKMPCIDVTCQLRGDMMKEMLQETAKLKEEMQSMIGRSMPLLMAQRRRPEDRR